MLYESLAVKVLLISGILIPAAAQRLGVPPTASGGWIGATIEAMRRHIPTVSLGVVARHAQASGHFEHDGVQHFVMQCKIGELVQPPNPSFVSEIREIIREFDPEVVHVNGSEFSFGMAVKIARPHIPALLSIQGISFLCRDVDQRVLRPGTGLRYDTLRDHASLLAMRKQESMERKTIAMFSHICGRTDWDKAHVHAMNPKAAYYSVQRLMRSEFWDVTWNHEQEKPHTVFSNSGGKARKGIHTLLEALAYLKGDYPNVEAHIPGMDFITKKVTRLSLRSKGYANYLFDLIKKWNLTDHVCGLGVLNAQDMALELTKAHVFAQVSHIENSPNSLSEAMLVGTPSIASYCGGTGSILKDQTEGLMYPTGDAALLAEHIRSLFENKELCRTFSKNARQRAIMRHDEKSITDEMMRVYREVIDSTHQK